MNENQNPSAASRLRAHWPLLAASMLSQACPSAAPLFHSCALFLVTPRLPGKSAHKTD